MPPAHDAEWLSVCRRIDHSPSVRTRWRRLLSMAVLGVAMVVAPAERPSASTAPRHLLIHVMLSQKMPHRVSGRLLVLMSKGTGKDRLAFGRVPAGTWVAAREVNALEPGAVVEVDADDLAFPTGFSHVPPGDYQIQAFLDVDHSYAYGGTQPGDLFGKPQTLVGWRPDASESLALSLDQEVSPTAQRALLPGMQPLKFRSPALTAFWGRPIDITGYVVLPPGYLKSARATYPTVYWTHGFGGTLAAIERAAERYATLMASKELPEMSSVMHNESLRTRSVDSA